jgi:hypothetical protein
MNKITKIVAMLMMVIMCVTLPTFQASAAPAPAVSSVSVISTQIKSDGYVYVYVKVIGYGKNIYSTYEGTKCTLSSTSTIGSPIVTGYIYEMKCEKAVVGSHVFTFKITSCNYPWNTVSTSSVITVSK